MLRITFLDVGNGHSMVLEHHTSQGIKYGVLDSNKPRGHDRPKALRFLEERNVADLAFIGLTHPHRDHLLGLAEILRHFNGKTQNVFTYPIPVDSKRQKSVIKQFIEMAEGSDGNARNFAREFLEFLTLVKNQQQISDEFRWEILDGFQSAVYCKEFTDGGGMALSAVLPGKALKGPYFTEIDTERLKFGDPAQNDLSFALQIDYAGHRLILGGDASHKSWGDRHRRVDGTLNAIVAKLPHHGSREDCAAPVLTHIYGPDNEQIKYAVISADGSRHPHPDVLRELKSKGIKPFCTARATICGASPVRDVYTDGNLDPTLNRFINTHAVAHSRNGPCQGDITLEITSGGALSIKSMYPTPCGFRAT